MSISLATDGIVGGSGGGGGAIYRMRAKDTSLGIHVYWDSDGSIDSTGAGYTGPGPLTDIVVSAVVGAPA